MGKGLPKDMGKPEVLNAFTLTVAGMTYLQESSASSTSGKTKTCAL